MAKIIQHKSQIRAREYFIFNVLYIEYKMYLKILQKLWRFKTSKALRSTVIKIPCILNFSKENFIKPEKPSFVNLKKTKDSFEDSFPICVF